MKVVSIDQGTPEWHDWRRNGVGASEVAALFGENPYSTKRELWLNKKGLLPDWFIQTDDYIFQKGHEFEEKMRAEYFAMTGENFRPVCIVHPEYDFIIASLDGRCGKKNFEAKLVSEEVKERIAREGVKGIPRHHWIQIQHQFLADETAEACIYFAHTLNQEAVVVEVLPDIEFQQQIKEKIIHFKTSLDENQEPPMTKDDFHFSDNDPLFEKLSELNAERKRLEAEFKAAEDAYKNQLKVIVEAHPHHHVASLNMAVKVKTMSRPGTITYTDIPELQMLSEEYLNNFRGEPSVYLQAWFPKKKA